MNRLTSLVAAVALLTAPFAAAAAPAAPVFSLVAKTTKVADGSSWQGNGGRQVALFGNNVYVAYHGPIGEPSVARSTDGGATWGVPAVLWNDPVKGNPTSSVRIAVGKDPLYAGKHIVYAAWGTADDPSDPADGQIMYSFYVDRPTGTGWSVPVSLSQGPASGYTLGLSAAPNGSVHAIYGGYDGVSYYVTARSADAPLTAPAALPWGDGGHNVALAFDAASNLYVVETHGEADGTHLSFHKKLATSAAWSTVDVAVDDATLLVDDNVSIAVFDASNIYIAYKQYPLTVPGGENHLWTAVSTNGGATWTKRIVAPNAAYYCTHPAIAVDAKKVVTVAAHCVEYGPNGKIFVNRSSDNGATWSASVAVPGNQQVSLALDANGKALVSAVLADVPTADQPFLNGAIDPGSFARPIYFTREK